MQRFNLRKHRILVKKHIIYIILRENKRTWPYCYAQQNYKMTQNIWPCESALDKIYFVFCHHGYLPLTVIWIIFNTLAGIVLIWVWYCWVFYLLLVLYFCLFVVVAYFILILWWKVACDLVLEKIFCLLGSA